MYCIKYFCLGLIWTRYKDPEIFSLPDPDPLLFSSDPDPTHNNGYIKIIFILNISTNSSLKLGFIRTNIMPTYLKYKYTIFYHFELRSGPGFFFQPDWSGSEEKNVGSSSLIWTDWIVNIMDVCNPVLLGIHTVWKGVLAHAANIVDHELHVLVQVL